jgi:hypothetical protein
LSYLFNFIDLQKVGGTRVSSINKSYLHDITEILLKVVLKAITITLEIRYICLLNNRIIAEILMKVALKRINQIKSNQIDCVDVIDVRQPSYIVAILTLRKRSLANKGMYFEPLVIYLAVPTVLPAL